MSAVSACNASVKCVYEKFKEKPKYCRILECQSPGCEKTFHAGCIGYERKSDADLNNLYFLCTKCSDYISQTTQMIEIALNNAITKLKKEIYDEIVFAKKEIIEAVVSKNSNEKNEDVAAKISGVIDKLAIMEAHKEQIIEPQLPETEADISKNDAQELENLQQPSITTQEVLTTEDEINNDVEKTKVICKEWFLSGVEAYLSIDQIMQILKRNNVNTYGVRLDEQQGSFVKRKYLRIQTKNNTALSRLLTSFRESKLGSQWNLRTTRPRPPVYSKKGEYSQKPTNRAEYEALRPRPWQRNSEVQSAKNYQDTAQTTPPWQHMRDVDIKANPNSQQICCPLTPSSLLHPSYASALQTGLVASHQLPYTQNQQMSQIVTALKGLKQIFAEFQV